MASIIGIGTTDNNDTVRKLYKGADAKLMRMEPEPKKVTANPKKENTAALIEQFIEERSGEYNKKKLYAIFSGKIGLKDFKKVISSLRESGKIAIDRNGIIVWIWYPELRDKYLNSKNLIL